MVLGVLIGALFMRTWPGQNEWGFAKELLVCCGSGLVLGLYLDYLAARRPTRMRITVAVVIMLTWLLVFAWN